jgi:hypothetical protein
VALPGEYIQSKQRYRINHHKRELTNLSVRLTGQTNKISLSWQLVNATLSSDAGPAKTGSSNFGEHACWLEPGTPRPSSNHEKGRKRRAKLAT